MSYSATIKDTNLELTPKMRIALKDTSNATKLDSAVDDNGTLVIENVLCYVVLDIHNDKSKDRQDYENYIIVSGDGEKYVTGSPSFWQNFTDIANEMAAFPDEPWGIEVYKMPSKNYQGKSFLSCSII